MARSAAMLADQLWPAGRPDEIGEVERFFWADAARVLGERRDLDSFVLLTSLARTVGPAGRLPLQRAHLSRLRTQAEVPEWVTRIAGFRLTSAIVSEDITGDGLSVVLDYDDEQHPHTVVVFIDNNLGAIVEGRVRRPAGGPGAGGVPARRPGDHPDGPAADRGRDHPAGARRDQRLRRSAGDRGLRVLLRTAGEPADPVAGAPDPAADPAVAVTAATRSAGRRVPRVAVRRGVARRRGRHRPAVDRPRGGPHGRRSVAGQRRTGGAVPRALAAAEGACRQHLLRGGSAGGEGVAGVRGGADRAGAGRDRRGGRRGGRVDARRSRPRR